MKSKMNSKPRIFLARPILSLLGVLAAFPSMAQIHPAQPSLVCVPFDLNEVRILEGSYLEKRMRDNQAWLLKWPNDQPLHAFRLNAGIPSSATSLGGWEKAPTANDEGAMLRGHVSGGHFLSALAKMYATTGDVRFKEKGDALVAELKKCQVRHGNGFLHAIPEETFAWFEKSTYDQYTPRARRLVWAPYYSTDKILAGMIDMHRYCGNATALEVAKGMSDYFLGRFRKLDQATIDRLLNTMRPHKQREIGAFGNRQNEGEHGAFSETCYNLYAITGRPEDLELARIFERKWFMDLLAARRDLLYDLHANCHIPMVHGFGRAFEITGQRRYREAFEGFWEIIQHHLYPTGGTSGKAAIRDAEKWWKAGQFLYNHERHTCESCCSHNLLEIAKRGFSWTADPRYADYYERTFFNSVLNQQKPDGSNDMLYFQEMAAGSVKRYDASGDNWRCCCGTGMEAYASLQDGAYFHSKDAIWINQFLPTELTWKAMGLRLMQSTDFPRTGAATFRFSLKQERAFKVHLRVPAWATNGMRLTVNGKPRPLETKPSGYMCVDRAWKDGDVMEYVLPMGFHIEPMPDYPFYVAVLYGPLVLAAVGNHEWPGSGKELIQNLKRSAGGELVFTAKSAGGAELLFKPLNEVMQEKYSVYCRVGSLDRPPR